MRKTVATLAFVLLLPTAAAEAAPRNAPPRVAITDIARTAGGEFAQYTIGVAASDPNGIVTEMVVDFGDGAQVWLLLVCDETTAPGDVAEQELTWYYPPGRYTLRAVAYSVPDCDSGSFQESRPDRARLVVR